MSYFKKARKYTEPSVALDEKIAKANQEYEKTGVDLVEIANSTSGVYYAATENPEIPPVQSEVPDTTGWRSGDPSLPAENASDIDPNDSSTWDTGGMGMEDLINPNSLPVDNGDDVSNQPTVATPDLSGFKDLRTDANDPNSSMASYGGIAKTSLLGVWGTSTGVIGPGNVFKTVLAAFGWPTGPLVDSGDPNYPSDRAMFGFYRMDDNATYGARLNMAAYMNTLPAGGVYKPYKCWVPFNSYGFGQSWSEFSSNPNNIWKHDGNLTLAYVQVSVYAGPGKYNSSQTVPPSTTVIFKDDIGKPENLPTDGGRLRDLLEELFGVGGSAAEELAFFGGGNKDPKWPKPGTLSGNRIRSEAGYAQDGAYPGGPQAFEDKYGYTPQEAIDAYNNGGTPPDQSSTGGDVGDIALNAGPSTPVKYDSHSGTFMPNMGGGRPGNVRPKGSAAFPQASTGGDGSQVASAAQTSPFPSDPASDASSSLGAKDGDEIAFGIFSKGEDGKLKINSADMQQYNWYKNTGDPSYIPAGADKEALEKEWQKKYGNQSSTWTPSSGTQVASTNLSGLFGSNGSGSGSTGQLNLPSWFSGYGNARNAKLDAEGRIYGYNYSGGYGYLSRGPGSGAPGTAESGYGTKGFDWDTQSGGTSWSFTRHDPSKVAASPNSPDPVKPGDVPTAPSSPYLPGKSPYKVASNRGLNRGKDYDSKGDVKGITTDSDWGKKMRDAVYGSTPKADASGRGGKGNNFGMGSAVVTKGKKKKNKNLVIASNEITGVFLNESNLLMEKNYLRDLREKKREKKVGDKIMKINIPGPKDELTVKAIDMLRQYKVSEKEMQEYAIIISNINQWIRDNPKEYAIWKIRYPVNDPRLAELNWRMDQQLRASDQYMDSHFPENEKLFGKLRQKIATNVDITDPRNFKDVKPAVTHKKLLQVSKALEKE